MNTKHLDFKVKTITPLDLQNPKHLKAFENIKDYNFITNNGKGIDYSVDPFISKTIAEITMQIADKIVKTKGEHNVLNYNVDIDTYVDENNTICLLVKYYKPKSIFTSDHLTFVFTPFEVLQLTNIESILTELSIYTKQPTTPKSSISGIFITKTEATIQWIQILYQAYGYGSYINKLHDYYNNNTSEIKEEALSIASKLIEAGTFFGIDPKTSPLN